MSRSKSGLFLMEMIIAICFFAVASGICVQLFVAAHSISQRSANIQMAVMNAQSAAAAFKATGQNTEALVTTLGASYHGGGQIVAWFNEEWEAVALEDGHHQMVVEKDLSVVPAVAYITVYDVASGDMLYSLSVSRYIGGE